MRVIIPTGYRIAEPVSSLLLGGNIPVKPESSEHPRLWCALKKYTHRDAFVL